MRSTLHRLIGIGLAAAVATSLVACQSKSAAPTNSPISNASPTSDAGPADPASTVGAALGGNPTECIKDFDGNKDYFPDKATFEFATGVTVAYHKSYKVVTVKQPQKDAGPVSYVLVQCGAPAPQLADNLKGALQISIPVKRIASGSTTQIPALQMLGAVDQVVGVNSGDKMQDGPIKQRIDSGKVVSFGTDSGALDVEKVVSLKLDLMLHGGMDSPSYAKLAELKVPIVAVSEWLDTTPLGRSEWTKYYGLFLNKEAKADEIFGKISGDYKAVVDKVATVSGRPTVFSGLFYKGTWRIPAGDSYVAAFLKDAGADYVFKNSSGTGSNEVSMENVLATAGQAKFWLNGTTVDTWKSKADVVQADGRLANLASVKDGNIWVPTLRISAGGGNDYWEQGVVRPDLVLGDLVAIFHPELMTGHKFFFYRQIK